MCLLPYLLVFVPVVCALLSQDSSGDPVSSQLALLQQIMNSFQVELTMVTDKLHRTESELTSTRDDLNSVKAELRLTEDDISVLKAQLNHGPDPQKFEEIKTELDLLKTAENTTHEELETLRSELTSAESEITVLKVQISACPNETEISKMASDLESINISQNEWHIVSEELVAVKRELRSAEENIRKLESQKASSSNGYEFGNLTEEIEALKSEYSVLESKVNVSTIDSLNTKVKANFEDVQTLRTQMLKHSVDITQTLAKVENNTAEMTDLNTPLRLLATSMPDIASLSRRLPILEANLTALWIWIGHQVTTSELLGMNANIEDLSQLEHNISSANNVLSDIHREILGLEDQNLACCAPLRNLTDYVNQLRTDVAFEVTQSTRKSGWTTLTFDTVQMNNGGGYNSTSGMFSAPISGTYLFWTNIDIFYGGIDYNEVYLVKGIDTIARGYAEISPSIDHNVMSLIAAIYLQAGARVHFEMMATYFAVEGGGRSSYGGTLIRVH